MKKSSLAFIFSLICFISNAQEQVFGFAGMCPDTTRERILKLPSMRDSNEANHCRIWFNNVQALDIEVLKTGVCIGVVANYFTNYWGYRMRKSKFYADTIIIDSVNARRIMNLFLNMSIKDIPDCRNIKGWDLNIADGTGFDIEYCNGKTYSDRFYSNPYYSRGLKEGERINSFVDSTYSSLNLGEIFAHYYKSVPKKRGIWWLLSL